MISSADTNPSEVLPVFSDIGIRTVFLVPTETGMNKSIMDATHPIQEYFLEFGIHDYKTQEQGNANKIQKKAFFVEEKLLTETTVSLYRPSTKNGDPRIWIYGLKRYAIAHNLLAIIVKEKSLFIINCSDKIILNSISNGRNPLFQKLKISSDGLTTEARELLNLLKGIGKSGWVQTLRPGDTGIGYTLETLLGIPENSSKKPDYKGIEIKSSRLKSKNAQLFAKVPNWKRSQLKGSYDILMKHGRFSTESNRLQINHTIHANKENSYGLRLEVDYTNNLLRQYCLIAGRREEDVLWEMDTLKGALKRKHPQTFWVSTKTRKKGHIEEFLYYEGAYTHTPNIDAFPLLLEAGDIFVDYLIKQRPNGSADDRGYSFKMKKKNLDALFGNPKIFTLL